MINLWALYLEKTTQKHEILSSVPHWHSSKYKSTYSAHPSIFSHPYTENEVTYNSVLSYSSHNATNYTSLCCNINQILVGIIMLLNNDTIHDTGVQLIILISLWLHFNSFTLCCFKYSVWWHLHVVKQKHWEYRN